MSLKNTLEVLILKSLLKINGDQQMQEVINNPEKVEQTFLLQLLRKIHKARGKIEFIPEFKDGRTMSEVASLSYKDITLKLSGIIYRYDNGGVSWSYGEKDPLYISVNIKGDKLFSRFITDEEHAVIMEGAAEYNTLQEILND